MLFNFNPISTPWKQKKFLDVFMFLEKIERERWHEMGYYLKLFCKRSISSLKTAPYIYLWENWF